MERLQKYLSRAGVASRRHAEAMIVDGRVKLNGKVVTVLGTQVDPGKDLVLLDGNLVAVNPERKYFLFYKPPGVVTTLSDPEGRPSVGDYAKDTGGRVFPIGRLDYDAEGALLLTDDGDLANKLMHPSHQVPRVYLAKVKGVPDEPSLQKLVDGVRLEDGMAHAVQAQIFEKAERNTWVKIIVTEGRQHLVKRLFAAIGHPVVRLYRPAHAGLPVHGLRPGELRELTNDEIRRVKAAADGDAQPEPRLTLPARRHGHAAPGFEPEEDTRPEGRGAKDDEARPEESVAPEQEESDAPPPEPRSSRADDSRSSRAESREPAPAARKPFAGRESARAGSEGRPPARVNRFGEASGGKSAAGAGAERGKFGDRGGKFGARDASGAGAKFGERGGKFGARDAGGPGAGRGKFGGPGDDRGGKRFGARDAGGPGAERGSKRFGARDVGGGDDRGGKRFGARDAGGGDDRGGKRFGARDAGGGDDRGGKRFGARDAGGGDDRGGKRFGARDAGGPGGKRFGARDAAGPGGKRFGGDRGGKRFGGPSSQEGFNGAGGKRRFGGDERPRPFPGEKGYEGKRKFGGPPANVSRPFPGERGVPGFGRKKMEEAARQEESPRSRFGGAGGPRSDGARGFGDPATRRGERASGPRRTGPGAKPGGFKAGGFKKGGFQKGGFKGGGRKGPGAGRSSPRKPRGSW